MDSPCAAVRDAAAPPGLQGNDAPFAGRGLGADARPLPEKSYPRSAKSDKSGANDRQSTQAPTSGGENTGSSGGDNTGSNSDTGTSTESTGSVLNKESVVLRVPCRGGAEREGLLKMLRETSGVGVPVVLKPARGPPDDTGKARADVWVSLDHAALLSDLRGTIPTAEVLDRHADRRRYADAVRQRTKQPQPDARSGDTDAFSPLLTGVTWQDSGERGIGRRSGKHDRLADSDDSDDVRGDRRSPPECMFQGVHSLDASSSSPTNAAAADEEEPALEELSPRDGDIWSSDGEAAAGSVSSKAPSSLDTANESVGVFIRNLPQVCNPRSIQALLLEHGFPLSKNCVTEIRVPHKESDRKSRGFAYVRCASAADAAAVCSALHRKVRLGKRALQAAPQHEKKGAGQVQNSREIVPGFEPLFAGD